MLHAFIYTFLSVIFPLVEPPQWRWQPEPYLPVYLPARSQHLKKLDSFTVDKQAANKHLFLHIQEEGRCYQNGQGKVGRGIKMFSTGEGGLGGTQRSPVREASDL